MIKKEKLFLVKLELSTIKFFYLQHLQFLHLSLN